MKKVLLTLTICIMMVLSLGGTVFANDEDSNQDGENTSEQVQEVEQEQTDDSSKENAEASEGAEVSEEKTNEELEDEAIDTQAEYKDDVEADSESGTSSNKNGFAIDGDFSEWEGMPHTTLSYNGWDDDLSDTSYGAVAQVDNMFYAHVHAKGSGTLSHEGYDFSDFWLFFNGKENDMNYGVGPRFFVLNDDGTIDWNEAHPKRTQLGKYHYYISVTEINTAQYKTIDDLKKDNKYFGEAIISIEEGMHRVELCLDTTAIVNYINADPNRSTNDLDPSALSQVSIKFGTNIGPNIMSTSGTPTGVIGVIACASIAAGSYYFIDKKRKFH